MQINANTEIDFQPTIDPFDYVYSTVGLNMNIKRIEELFQPQPELLVDQVRPPIITVKGAPLNNENFSYRGSSLSSKAEN